MAQVLPAMMQMMPRRGRGAGAASNDAAERLPQTTVLSHRSWAGQAPLNPEPCTSQTLIRTPNPFTSMAPLPLTMISPRSVSMYLDGSCSTVQHRMHTSQGRHACTLHTRLCGCSRYLHTGTSAELPTAAACVRHADSRPSKGSR